MSVAWLNVEPQQGQWDFSKTDSFIDDTVSHNADFILSLGFTPKWASSQPNGDCIVGPGGCWRPNNIQDWKDYVRTVATRYKGRVHYYEIWNEPNGPNYWRDTVANMVSLSSAAYEVLKQVDPDIQVITPACIGPRGLLWLGEFLKQGGGKFADIIGFHFYFAPSPPESVYGEINEVRALMSKYGVDDKPLWDTEITWTGDPVDESTQVAYLARTLMLNAAGGVQRVFWYEWGNPEVKVPMVGSDSKTLTAAGKAFSLLQTWLIGGTVSSCTSKDLPAAWRGSHAMWTCDLEQRGKTEKILWNPDGTTSFQVPPSWGVNQVQNLSGQVSPVAKTGQIQVGIQPILLSASK